MVRYVRGEVWYGEAWSGKVGSGMVILLLKESGLYYEVRYDRARLG